MHLSALLDEGLGDWRAALQAELGRKEPTRFAVMVGISILEADEQGRQSVEILPWSPGRVGAGASISDSPAGGSEGWGGGSSGVLCCPPGGTNMVRQVRHFSVLSNFSFQRLQQN